MVIVGPERSADSMANSLVGIMVNLAALLVRRDIHALHQRAVFVLVVAAGGFAVTLAASNLGRDILDCIAFGVGVNHTSGAGGPIKCLACHGVGVEVTQEAISLIGTAILLALARSLAAILVASHLAHLAGSHTLRDAVVSAAIRHATANVLLGAATRLQALGGLLGVMLLIKLRLFPLLHRHAVLLGKLLVLLEVSLGMLPSFLANLTAALLGGSSAAISLSGLHHSQSHLGHRGKTLGTASLRPRVTISHALRSFPWGHCRIVRNAAAAASAATRPCSRCRWCCRLDRCRLINRQSFGRRFCCAALRCTKGVGDNAGIKTARSLLGATALLHAANVLDAITFLIGFLNIAVDQAIRCNSFSAVLAHLAISATAAHLALNFVIRLGVNFAAALELAAADGAHAGLNIRI